LQEHRDSREHSRSGLESPSSSGADSSYQLLSKQSKIAGVNDDHALTVEKDRSLRFVNSKEIEEPQLFGIHRFYVVTLNPTKKSGRRAIAVAFRRTAKYRSVFAFLHPSLSMSDFRSAVRSQLIIRCLPLRPATLVRVSAAGFFLGNWNAPTKLSMEVAHEATQQKRKCDPE
jgi:hypothetical protein